MRHLTILFLGKIWPEPRASAACSRVLDLTRALIGAGARVVFSSDAKPTSATAAVVEMGAECVRLAPNDEAFSHYLVDLRPDVTFFDTFTTEEKFGWRVQSHVPDCLRILDTIDLHFLRKTRERIILEGASTLPQASEVVSIAGDLALREVAAIHRSDLTLMTSDREMQILIEYCDVPVERLHLCRLHYPSPPVTLPFDARRGYCSIGSFRHPPNVDGLRWLRTSIWPKIRRLKPDAEISIWGSYPRPEQMQLSSAEDGFRVHGPIAEQFPALERCRLNLAPLRFGAGIKGKIADGWWSGTPAVTTSIGAEGMTDNLPFGGVVADDAEFFAEAAVRLHDDLDSWKAASSAGQTIINRLYSPEATTGVLLERLEKLAQSRDEVRARNFTGRMLWQQGLRATEYFSRWIEAKSFAATEGG